MNKNRLSILIPSYNGDCRDMVRELSCQAEAVAGLDYEIIIADDGSPCRESAEALLPLRELPCCKIILREVNSGRSAIRNFLAQQAQKEWLLFLDCDMAIISSRFVADYLETDGDVVYGGYRPGDGDDSCLRYKYEKACQPQHAVEQRRKRPFQHFHTSNFLVRRDIMLSHPFDETFRQYGYEDVFFGKQLKQAGIDICHIANPTGFLVYESNDLFVAKTEEGLRTLHDKRQQLRGYSQMLTFVDGIHLNIVRRLIRLWHALFGAVERRILCSRRPSLHVFKLYKLGYYLTLTKNDDKHD